MRTQKELTLILNIVGAIRKQVVRVPEIPGGMDEIDSLFSNIFSACDLIEQEAENQLRR